jgi:hypothetical protein
MMRGGRLDLPAELRFVNCGRKGAWLDANLTRNVIHFGWRDIPHDVLQRKDGDELRGFLVKRYEAIEYENEAVRKGVISTAVPQEYK